VGGKRIHKMRYVPGGRPIELQMRESLFSVLGVAFSFVGNHPRQAAANAPAGSVRIPTTNPRRNLRMAPPAPSDFGN